MKNSNESQKVLSPADQEELLAALKERFEKT